jgi:putative signal transducing protein
MTRDSELVEVAYVSNAGEAAMVQGLLEEAGIPSMLQGVGFDGPRIGVAWVPNAPQRVMVHAPRLEEARALIAKTLAENEGEALPEIANASYLEEAEGGKPRSYGLIGGMGRIYLVSFGAMAVAFGVFLLLRAV